MIRKILTLVTFLFSLCGYARTIYVVSVGISDYKYIKDLSYTETDAIEIAEIYKSHTRNVKLLVGPQATHDNILSTLRTYFAQAKEDDTIVFFFSGHGAEGGLCAYDTKSSQSLVTYAEVQEVIRHVKAKNKQLFIDACFSGGLRSKAKTPAKAASDAHAMSADEGVMLFLSSRSNETSQENRWSSAGFYTQYLIKGIKGEADYDNDRIITAKEIFTYVKNNVSERTNKKQHPVMWGKFSDDMCIMNWNK